MTLTEGKREAMIDSAVAATLGKFFDDINDLDAESVAALDRRRRKATAKLSSLDDDFIVKAHDEIIRSTKLGEEISKLIESDFSNSAIHEYLVFEPYMPPYKMSTDVHNALKSIHRYKQLPKVKDYAQCDEVTIEKIGALVTLVGYLYLFKTEAVDTSWVPLSVGRGGARVNDDSLIELVLEHPRDARSIAEVVTERETTDIEFIRSIVFSETKSLTEGNL